MPRKITGSECKKLLAARSQEIQAMLQVSESQLGMPTDGKGVRVAVHVRRGMKGLIPSSLVIDIDSEDVEVPLDVDEDFDKVHAS
jgi:hypothetical protein